MLNYIMLTALYFLGIILLIYASFKKRKMRSMVFNDFDLNFEIPFNFHENSTGDDMMVRYTPTIWRKCQITGDWVYARELRETDIPILTADDKRSVSLSMR